MGAYSLGSSVSVAALDPVGAGTTEDAEDIAFCQVVTIASVPWGEEL